MHLMRYERALESISHCGKGQSHESIGSQSLLVSDRFDECLQLIKDQCLYKLALNIFTDRESHECHVIGKLYGDYLMEKEMHKEAAISK